MVAQAQILAIAGRSLNLPMPYRMLPRRTRCDNAPGGVGSVCVAAWQWMGKWKAARCVRRTIESKERFGFERQGSSVVSGPWPVVSGCELQLREYKRPMPTKTPLPGRQL
jgi:hypothetical protein